MLLVPHAMRTLESACRAAVWAGKGLGYQKVRHSFFKLWVFLFLDQLCSLVFLSTWHGQMGRSKKREQRAASGHGLNPRFAA